MHPILLFKIPDTI